MEAQQEVPINVNPEEIEGQLDPMNHPIPGESLTSEPGDKPFENAPHTNDAELVIDKAIQAHGAMGVSQDTPLAKMAAGARVLRIADGPDEVHLQSIAKREINKHR